MSQNDFVLADAPGASFRADVNSALQALATLSSGATAPSTTYALMEWLDTTTNTRKQRNAANSAWLVRGTIDETMVLSRSSNTILDISDRNKTLIATGSYTQTLDAAATLGDGWEIGIIVDSGVTLTLDPNASETIDGATTLAISGPSQGRIVCNGSAFRAMGFAAGTLDTTRIDVASASTVNLTSSAPSTRHINITGTTTITAFTVAAGLCYFVRFAASLTLTNNASIVTQTGQNIVTQPGDTCILRATAANTVEVLAYSALSDIRLSTKQASTSGVAINFNSIPSWVRRITVMLDGVSTNGASNPIIQIGDSGGVETSGYLGSAMLATNGSTTIAASFTTGFGLNAATASTTVLHGIAILELVDSATNTWSFSFAGSRTTDGAGAICSGGTKSLSATLDRISITTVGGTETFDAGNINITME